MHGSQYMSPVSDAETSLVHIVFRLIKNSTDVFSVSSTES